MFSDHSDKTTYRLVISRKRKSVAIWPVGKAIPKDFKAYGRFKGNKAEALKRADKAYAKEFG